jgi:ferric-dicitrate binding protein FerR (iron transport regulator)
MSERADLMAGLIERSLRGEASDAELQALVAWRHESAANERSYRRTRNLVVAAGELSTTQGPVRAPAAVDIIALAAGPARRARSARWPLRAAAAAAVILALANVWHVLADDERAPTEVVTGVHEMTTVKLGDGTVVRLAPSSRLVVSGSRRDVTLEGRAYFAVTPDPQRPFLVHTTLGTARVLGTRFQLDTERAEMRLLVLEGVVALDAPENSVEVRAGQQTAVRNRAVARPTPLADPEAALGWMGRILVFQGLPLREAANQLERLYGVRVMVTDSSLLTETVTATFTDRPLDDVVSVLCIVLNAQCTTRAGVVVMHR